MQSDVGVPLTERTRAMATDPKQERLNEIEQADRSKSPDAQQQAPQVTGSAPQQAASSNELDEVSRAQTQGEGNEEADPRDGSGRSRTQVKSSLDEGQEASSRAMQADARDTEQDDDAASESRAPQHAQGGEDRATDSQGKKLVNPLHEQEDRQARPQGHRPDQQSSRWQRKSSGALSQGSTQLKNGKSSRK